jgi:hypothetical protein
MGQLIIELNSLELQEIEKFCEINNFNIDETVTKCFKNGFIIEKYGFLGKEIELPVEKIIHTDDDLKVKQLQQTIQDLTLKIREKENEIKELKETIKNFNISDEKTQVTYLRSSNLEDNLYKD